MTHKKVASITTIKGENELRLWLDTIPYHISNKKRERLVILSRGFKTILWLDKRGQDFFFFE